MITISSLLTVLLAACSPTPALSSTPPANQATASQIEPNAGKWKTWLLKSGDQLRLPAPPDKAATVAEIKELKSLAGKRDAKALEQIAFWNTGAPAYRWNEMLITGALKRNMNSAVSSRALALLHAAIYDATVAAWDSKVAHNRPRPSAFDPSLTTAIPTPNSPAYPSEHAVTAGAASAILAYLFPEDAKKFVDAASEASNAFLLAGVQYPSDVKAGLELGGKVAQLAIEHGKNDGSTAKWTGTGPTEPGHWMGENPVLPTLGTWKTWALTSGSQFRPPPPPAYNSPQMAAELKELQVFTRTPKTNGDAMFWEFGAGGLRNFVFWNDQISKKLMEYRLDDNPPRAARAYALTSIAYYDAIVACFDAKYAYWGMRPSQIDPNFKPLFTTPNHPSYPSAHSCLSGSAAAVLANLFPHDAATFNGLAEQAGEARIWGGIHFAPLRFGLYYDFRNPPQWQRPFAELYGEIFEQIVWAEQHGFDNVWLSEHHLAEDGYAPSVLPTAAAIAAKTRTIRIGTAVMDLPFHHPIRVAEDAATVDVISNGRFELGVGVGYRVEEFDSFGIPKTERGRRTTEALEIIRRLLDGETLTFKGQFYEVYKATLSPTPVQQPRLPIWAGGFTPAAAQRAARLADGFIAVAGPSPELAGHYVAALQALGKPTDTLRLAGGPFWLIPAEDPDKTWHEAAPHVLYQMNLYAEWLAKSGMPMLPHIRDTAHLRELGLLNVVDVDTCIATIRAFASSVSLTHYYAFTLPPGLPASWAQPHLELFANKVIPAFR